MRIAHRFAALLFAVCLVLLGLAQPKTDPNIKKPKAYEERKLGSEKMAGKKFTLPRHFFQNMFTHYNYFFNANNKLNDIIGAAKMQHQEDYARLLPFYNYSLSSTAQSTEIDSILEKCTAGILLHDLRNDWIDNMYLLMGRAYMLRQDFDSAAMTFQFINYTYSPKDKDGDDQLIASNRTEGSNAFTIATKEKRNVVQKVFTRAPSRNESFVWLIRNFTEKGEYIDAASLITTLRNDPNFPSRLKEELAEAEAYNYYKQEIYDSSAHYLAQAIPQAGNRTEKARWYYLIGQMYQKSGNNQLAAEYFARCVRTTLDPIMEVYARLSSIRLNKSDDPKLVQQNIDEIVKMARKEKYEEYRDIIYYAAALMELERNGHTAAENFLQKSVAYNTNNPDQRSRSFLLLSDMLYDNKAYGRSGFFYDSVMTNGMDSAIAGRVAFRKPPTRSIYDQDRILYAQDSLQRIAALPEAERNTFIRALSRKLRKERGLKEEVDSSNLGQSVGFNQIGKGSATLFDNSNRDFYFYNPQQRASGYTEFKQRWGGRPNVDNWRRSAAVQKSFTAQQQAIDNPLVQADDAFGNAKGKGAGNGSAGGIKDINSIYEPQEITFDALSANLPLDQTQQTAANTSINEALLKKGQALQNSIEDYPEAIKVYEELLARLSENDMAEEVMFNLIYCYSKVGDLAKANAMKQRLNKDYRNGNFTARVNNPALGTENANPAATEAYKKIYNQFIEGDFEQAVAAKRKADSLYGRTFWNPQLLYIESVYYVKERQDTAAINRLNVLAATYPTSPLAERARLLVDVLGRRRQIEDYLVKLKVTRASEDSAVAIPDYTPVATPTPVVAMNNSNPRPNEDSLKAVLKKASVEKAFQDSMRNAAAARYAAEKAAAEKAALQTAAKARQDSLQTAEAGRQARLKATRDSVRTAQELATRLRADSLRKATANKLAAAKSAKDSLLIAQAAARQARQNSIKAATAAKLVAAKARQDSLKEVQAARLAADKAAKDAAREALAALKKWRQDSLANAIALKKQQRLDSIAGALAARRLADSLREVEARKPKPVEGFLVDPASPQLVMILLNRVDAVYLNECVNAFNRYHPRIGGQLSTQKLKLDNEYSMVLVSSPLFTSADAAMTNYIDKVKPKAAADIVPWLDAAKFRFYLISPENLEQLKQSKNVSGYLKALNQSMPNRF